MLISCDLVLRLRNGDGENPMPYFTCLSSIIEFHAKFPFALTKVAVYSLVLVTESFLFTYHDKVIKISRTLRAW
jgi:hypothetical protein